MRGLPRAYQQVAAPVRVSGPGGEWQLVRQPDAWQLQPGLATTSPAAEDSRPPDIAWKLFTKGLRPAEARP
jgi:hypothetical protein